MDTFRTDMAIERNELYQQQHTLEKIEGIDVEEEQKDKIKITRVTVTNQKGSTAIGKPEGSYITIDIDKMRGMPEDRIDEISEIVSSELKEIINQHIQETDPIFIVGLGNLFVTPDALGPKVVPELEITRHILQYMPQCLPEETRPVSAIAPGVLGTTGIETAEVIRGIVDHIHPEMVIVIDALATRNIQRISSSIQISDTGIVPGGGVENTRTEISQKTLGIPVIAIGIPTVVDFATITEDGIQQLIESFQKKGMVNEMLNHWKENDHYEEIKEVFRTGEYNMIVTPKEIDELIETMKTIVSKGINEAL